ncbi:aldo/keto reductase [Rhodococcus sp. 06-462-5]|uniref:aldo/keto reductase n=1 Tax=Nocardiaceae TaxID=85025 RepID=UPI00050CE495|nr:MULTISPECIES: aldo/keto reductase [Rhodococcus]OZC74027.1 aldo/keto reductase [Rhodococcus sp. 06-462-5]OZE68023.1 aldo/keto reductase [Rhodococcus sp. 02-925g]OZF51955.1 aldo/keto reductase [Rhodococcus sp. 14-1411-2a]
MTTTDLTSMLRRQLRPALLGTGNFGGIAGTVAPGVGLDAARATTIMDHAVEVGITVFDTADIYAQGASERIVGEWVRAHPDADVLIQTKAGNTATGPNLSPEHVVGRLQRSIDTLGRVDLFLSHRVDPDTPWKDSLPVFSRAVEDGTIRAYGVSNVTATDLTEVLHTADKLSLVRPALVQNEYSWLTRRDDPELLPIVEAEGLLYTPYSPLANGLLAGRYSNGERPGHGDRASIASGTAHLLDDPRAQFRLRAFDDVAAQYGLEPASLALAWVMHQPQIAAPIISVSRDEQWSAAWAANQFVWTPEVDLALNQIPE